MATIYKYNDYEYRDEAGEFTADEVKRQLTQYFPELANATTSESTNADGEKVVTFVKRAGTKGGTDGALPRQFPGSSVEDTELHAAYGVGAYELPETERPMAGIDLFRLEDRVRCARNGRRTIELDPNTVLSLINEAWYLRSLLGKPADELAAALAKGDGL